MRKQKDIRELIEREKFILYVVTDDKYLPYGKSKRDLEKIRDIVRRCADGGAKIFQYRAKKIPADIQFAHCEVAEEECRKNNLYFFVNDRVDIAILCSADGVHLGQNDIPPEKVKEKFKIQLGFSTHSEKEVMRANEIEAINYISFGPIFATSTKEDALPPRGISKLKKVIEISKHPVVAIGGINKENVKDVVSTGCNAVAVISSVFKDGKIDKNCKMIIERALKNL